MLHSFLTKFVFYFANITSFWDPELSLTFSEYPCHRSSTSFVSREYFRGSCLQTSSYNCLNYFISQLVGFCTLNGEDVARESCCFFIYFYYLLRTWRLLFSFFSYFIYSFTLFLFPAGAVLKPFFFLSFFLLFFFLLVDKKIKNK